MNSVVRLTLERYGLKARRARLLQEDREAVWRIDCKGGATFVLRIYSFNRRAKRWIEGQCRWLRAIARDTKLIVPEPVANLEGEYVTPLPGRRFAVLTRWVPGRRRFRRNGPGVEVLEQVGQIMATLHRHGQTFKLSKGFSCPKWDWKGLFGANSPWSPTRAIQLDARTRRTIELVSRNARSVMRQLGEHRDVFGLIHGDLIQANYLIDGDRVHAIDFADFGRGFFLYDMAITLLMLRPFDPRNLQREAFLRGYRSVRPLSKSHESLLDTFIDIRSIVLARWLLASPNRVDRQWARQALRQISVSSPKLAR